MIFDALRKLVTSEKQMDVTARDVRLEAQSAFKEEMSKLRQELARKLERDNATN